MLLWLRFLCHLISSMNLWLIVLFHFPFLNFGICGLGRIVLSYRLAYILFVFRFVSVCVLFREALLIAWTMRTFWFCCFFRVVVLFNFHSTRLQSQFNCLAHNQRIVIAPNERTNEHCKQSNFNQYANTSIIFKYGTCVLTRFSFEEKHFSCNIFQKPFDAVYKSIQMVSLIRLFLSLDNVNRYHLREIEYVVISFSNFVIFSTNVIESRVLYCLPKKNIQIA